MANQTKKIKKKTQDSRSAKKTKKKVYKKKPQGLFPKIRHNGKNFVVIHKPAGWTVYQESSEGDVKSYVEKKLDKKLLPVHRLDKSTCGLVLFALNWRHSQRFIDLFKEKKIVKKYVAFVHGLTPDQELIDIPLKKHKGKGTELATTRLKTLEHYEVILEDEERFYSLVELELESGRYHQIRRHLKAIKHPIVGDELYGNAWNNNVFKEKFGIKRALLSAVYMEFFDPIEKKKYEFEGAPDPDFVKLLKRFSS